MVKKIKVLTCLAIVLILVIGGISLGVVNATDLKQVENLKMADNTDSTISLCWKKVKNADGYRLFVENKETNEFEAYKDVEGSDNCKFDLNEIEGGSIYRIKIAAFREFRNKEYISDLSEPVTVYSMPAKLDVVPSSEEEGILLAKWTVQKNAAGYEILYSKDQEFKDYQHQELEGADKNMISVKDLTPKDVYFTKGRSYIVLDGQKIYGEWSDVNNAAIKEKVVMPENLDPNKPMVALTFDDGPSYAGENNATERILNTLEKHGARASFFMVGSRVNDANAYLLKKEIEIGCEIGNHTLTHERYGKKVTANDICKSSERIKQYCGKAPSIFRCPGGMMSSAIQEECRKEGMPIAYWSVDTEDWKSKNPKAIYDAAMDHVYDGAIILMHEIYPTTADAVEKLVPALIEDGYQVVTVSELIVAKTGKEPQAGQQYVDYETINNNT